ncbi:hypothetical protein LCGC14_2166400 [marine sediment metagenome]|uniref:Uncharacterized protein n=1 Tax=marine sediment metagenome TaxID=412755 RepID=A0A0F9EDL7_9ZZZZ
MTEEICECGMLKTSHPTRYCEKFKPQNNFETPTDPINGLGWKMKSQNHSHPENTSDLVEASKCSEDTEPDATLKQTIVGTSGSGNETIIYGGGCPEYNKEDRKANLPDTIQSRRDGEPSKEFIETYPEQAKKTFTNEEMKKAKNQFFSLKDPVIEDWRTNVKHKMTDDEFKTYKEYLNMLILFLEIAIRINSEIYFDV